MATPTSKHKSTDSQQPSLVETSSDMKKVEDVQDRPDAENLNATDLAADPAESSLPSVDTLSEDSDVSAFMSPGIHENLKQRALRKLFHLPKFNCRDGLDDYDDDYRSFKPLGDILTSDRRYQLERLARGINNRQQQLSDCTAKATAGLNAEARSRRHDQPTPGQAGAPADRTPIIAAGCVLCRRPDRSASRTSKLMNCAQWFDQCPSSADANNCDTAQIAMEFNRQAEISSAQVQAGSPPSNAQLGRLSVAVHAAIKARIESGEGNPIVIFHDAGLSVTLSQDELPDFPEKILWFPISSNGLMLDIWLAAVAWGADRVAVVIGDATGTVLSLLENQMAAAHAILDGLGLERERIGLVSLKHFDSASLSAVCATPAVLRKLRPILFKPVECGRAMIYSAVDGLLAQTAPVQPAVRLPHGVPFGDVHIDSDACTLCMACVAACPTEALRDGVNDPQILFQEERCIQCGLCQTACPETAIALIAADGL